jgi:hypothetical protein
MMGGFIVKLSINIKYLCIEMTIDQVYKFVDFIIKKSNSGGYLTPDEFNLIINRAQIQYFNKLYGNQNDYRYDRPVPKIAYAITEKISNSLSPFLSDSTALVIDGNGQVNIPSDLFQTVSITHTIDNIEYEITRVEQDRIANNLSSYYDAPTSDFPIYSQLRTKFQFYPKNLATASLFYLKKPTDMVWGYTTVSGRPVYNSGTSVQPLWKDMDINEIIYIALSYIGVNLKDGDVSQFAQLKTQTGL